MVKQTQVALNDATEWLGDWHPLAEQLGSADGLVELSSIAQWLHLEPVEDLLSLRSFLQRYHEDLLFPIELPAIQAAHEHTRLNEVRELFERDRKLEQLPMLRGFANASKRIGRHQLNKLRPLRDERIIRRYIEAIELGEAFGWHTLVYGLTLAIYSLPLRQGLLGYAHQTTRGFIYSAARPLRLSERHCRDLFNELCADLPNALGPLFDQPSATVS